MANYLEFGRTIYLSDSFRDLIKRSSYEKYILCLINRSSHIFRGITFTRNESQSHGECDFVDNHGEKYDAKLLLDKERGSLIGEEKNNIVLWIEDIMREVNEFSQLLLKAQNYSFIPNTRLYTIMEKRLRSVKPNEHVIFFLPYPLVVDAKHSVFIQFSTDYIQAVYNCLLKNDLIGNRRVYFIYPSMEKDIYVLRDDHSFREYISVPELSDIITFTNYVLN